MKPEVLAAIDAAVASVRDLLRSVPPETRYELRQDLRQELALRVVEGKVKTDISPSSFADWLRKEAKHWLMNAFRDHVKARETEAEYVSGTGKRYRKNDDWFPRWYPPHKDAVEHVPFACDGARVMHVQTEQSFRDVETALVEFVDSRSSQPSRAVHLLVEGTRSRTRSRAIKKA